ETPRAGLIVRSVIVTPGLPPVSGSGDPAVALATASTRSARVLYGGELATLGAALDSDTVDLTDQEWHGGRTGSAASQPVGAA
ncbi:MAG: hypothetical protein AAF328_11750, partial [Planctomycetota bacterium]